MSVDFGYFSKDFMIKDIDGVFTVHNIIKKEYDKLKEQSKFITDPNMIAIVDKIGELIRALRKNIRMPL